MSTPHHQHGLTLVEVVIAMGLLAITAVMSIPPFSDMLQRRSLIGWADQLAADIRFARSEAVARADNVRMTLHTGASQGCYVIHTGPPDACTCDTTNEPATCAAPAVALKTVWTNPGHAPTLTANVRSQMFTPQGTVTPTGTWTLTAPSGQQVQHVVNLLGRVRSCTRGPSALHRWKAC